MKTNVISDQEFWRIHENLIKNERQRVQFSGLKNNILPELLDQSGCNKYVFRLTPDIKRNIFIQLPAVRKAYEATVPAQLQEKEFWLKFFQSTYFHRKIPGSTGIDDFDKQNTTTSGEQMDIIEKYSRIEENEIRNTMLPRYISVDSQVDLTKEEQVIEDEAEIFGTHDDVLFPIKTDPNGSLLRRFNRMAMNIANEVKENPHNLREVVFSKPDAEASSSYIPLNIPEKKLYFANDLQLSSSDISTT